MIVQNVCAQRIKVNRNRKDELKDIYTLLCQIDIRLLQIYLSITVYAYIDIDLSRVLVFISLFGN